MAWYDIMGRFETNFKFKDFDGGYSHLKPLEEDGVWNYLVDYITPRVRNLLTNCIIDVEVNVDFNKHTFEVLTYPITHAQHEFDEYIGDYDDRLKFLNDLAYDIGMMILDLEADLIDGCVKEFF